MSGIAARESNMMRSRLARIKLGRHEKPMTVLCSSGDESDVEIRVIILQSLKVNVS